MELDQKLDYRVPYSIVTALEAELKCSICLDIFKNPHSTNCGHYFCKECLTSYLKEMKFKCTCPLCKKTLSKRELTEAPKLQAIAEIMQKLLDESTQIKPSSFSEQTNTKKRKLNDFMKSPEYSPKAVFLTGGSTRGPGYKMKPQDDEEEEKTSQTMVSADRPKKSLPSSNLISEMLAKLDESGTEESGMTPNRFQGPPYASLQEQTTVNRNKETNTTTERRPSNLMNKQICLVTTALPHNLQDEVQKFCKKFKAKQYKDFNENITHMIIYPSIESKNVVQAKRTVKYVLGVIKGIWIVSFKWVINSILNEEVQNEDDYETTEDCYGIGAPRFSRLNGGLHNLFKGFVFVLSEGDKHVKPAIPKNELSAIIDRAGGTVIKSSNGNVKNVLNIVLQGAEEDPGSGNKSISSKRRGNLISHKWVLDSISNHTMLEYGSYLI